MPAKREKYCYTFEERCLEVEARYMTMMIHDKEIEMDVKEEGTILAYVGMVRKKKQRMQ